MFAGAILAAARIALLHIPAVQAEDAVVVNSQNAPDLDNYHGGMSASNPRVEPFLEARPDQFVVLCVAGCNGAKSKIVELLPRPVKGRAAEFQPSAARPEDKGKGKGQFAAEDIDDVVCLAGCTGKPGQVLQRDLDLPPPVVAKPAQEKTSDAAPPGKPENAPEPLDTHP